MMFFLSLAAAITAPSLALPQDVSTRVVATADLDLSTPTSRRALERRIASATEAVCGSYFGARDVEEERITRCRADVRRQIAARLPSGVRSASR